MSLDANRLIAPAPTLQGEGYIPIELAAETIGLPLSDLLTELSNAKINLYTVATDWPGWEISDLALIERDYDDSFLTDSIEEQGLEAKLSGYARAYRPLLTLSALQQGKTPQEELFLVEDRNHRYVFFLNEPVEVPISSWNARKGDVLQIKESLAIRIPPEALKPVSATATPVPATPAPPPSPVASPASRYGNMPFSELFAQYAQHHKWRNDQKKRMETEAGLFTELMDDPRLADINVEMIHHFAERLAELPHNIYLAKRNFKVESLKDVTEMARLHKVPLKQQETIAGHVGRISQILKFAKDNEMMGANPAAGYQRKRGAEKMRRAQDERQIFSPEELDLIFPQSWFKKGVGEFTLKKGWTTWRPYYFWLPLLALTSGGRLNELSQLYLEDIRQTEGGVWYLDFNLDGTDKLDADKEPGEDKSLKTVNALRVVPLHNAVIQAGFIEYIEALKKAGYSRLFPELKHDRVKGYGKAAGSWFNERFLGGRLGIPRDGKKTFHSFRHNFATAVERLGLTERHFGATYGA